MKTEDIDKIRRLQGCTVLLAGNMSNARAIFTQCIPFIEKYPVGGNEIEITELKNGLAEAVRRSKRTLLDASLSAEFAMTYEELLSRAQAEPQSIIIEEASRFARRVKLNAQLIVSTFTDDEAAILAIEADSTSMNPVPWSNNYAAVGTGSNIAAVFLAQRDYHDGMKLEECLYRVVEAKTAAEKDLHVGRETRLEFSIPGQAYSVAGLVGDMTTRARKLRSKRVEFMPLDEKFVTVIPPAGKPKAASK